MILIAVVGSLFITLPYIDPPVTDQSMMLFFKGPDYLPTKNVLTHQEIRPGLSRLLAEERHGYKVVFYLACLGLLGILGLTASSGSNATASVRLAHSVPSSNEETRAEQDAPPNP